MAKRILKAQMRPVNCNLREDIDRLQTKPGLALTPGAIKELTDKGIAVSLPNQNQFLAPTSATTSWDIEPEFKRDATLASTWEAEQLATQKVMRAHRKDKQIFG